MKALITYVANKPLILTLEGLTEKLEKHRSRLIGKAEYSCYGFTPVHSGHQELAIKIGSGYLIKARKQERILPASVVKRVVDAKVEEIETTQGRTVYKKERDSIKEETLITLLPRAFVNTTDTLAWVSPTRVLVFAGSFKKAEELTSKLRSALGSLPFTVPLLKNPAANTMTHWLTGQTELGNRLTLGNKTELRDPGEEGGVIRIKGESLTSKEIINHLDCGKQVGELQLSWDDTLTFDLNETLQIKQLKVCDELVENAEDIAESGEGDEQALREATWLLTVSACNVMITDVLDALGGVDDH